MDPSKPVVCSVTELCLGSIRAEHDRYCFNLQALEMHSLVG